MKHYFGNKYNKKQAFMFIKMLVIGILTAYLTYHILLFFIKTINNL
jgi:VIT1/CCC1 family predicted Fe2+/Mn2+ transporter